MLRNALITGVAAALMGGFVLALEAINPQTQQPEMAAVAGGAEAEGVVEDQAQRKRPMNARRPSSQAGRMSGQPQEQPMQPSQRGSAMGGAQSSGMQPKSGMGMCPMMGMMGGMGGKKTNQSDQSMSRNGQQADLEAELQQLQRELEELKQSRRSKASAE